MLREREKHLSADSNPMRWMGRPQQRVDARPQNKWHFRGQHVANQPTMKQKAINSGDQVKHPVGWDFHGVRTEKRTAVGRQANSRSVLLAARGESLPRS